MINDIINLLNQLPEINVKESNYIYNNNRVPRVTKIINRCIHNDGLMYWANNLGFKRLKYNQVLNDAANIGTECHNNIDNFLSDTPLNKMILPEVKNAYDSFLKWYNDINTYANVEVLMHETSLVCKHFGGTLDGLYKINNKIYIIDYKTSNHITFNYFLQLAAYIFMLESQHNMHIDGAIIVQLSKNEISYNEYVLDFSNPMHKKYMDDCKETFLIMVLYYYHLYKIEKDFDHINWS